MSSQSDTEALKALVAKWREQGAERFGEPRYASDAAMLKCADELHAAIERMLASQMGEDVKRARWNGEGEPYFVIRGKDKFALKAIGAWLDAARKFDDEETERTGFVSEPLRACIKSAHNVWDSVMSWQANFGVKVPDLPAEPSPVKFAKNRHRVSDFGKEHLKHVNPDGTDRTISIAAPAAGMDAEAATMEILAGDLCDPEHTGWSMNSSVPKATLIERIAAIIRKHSVRRPQETPSAAENGGDA